MVARGARRAPPEITFIDDSEPNVAAARVAGEDAHLFEHVTGAVRSSTDADEPESRTVLPDQLPDGLSAELQG